MKKKPSVKLDSEAKYLLNANGTVGKNALMTNESIRENLLDDGEFLVNGRLIKRSVSSLICKFTNENVWRQKAILITENKWFDNFIMLCIVINSICMASFDYIADNRCSY